MSELKFAPDLFLEQQELDRFKKFLDEKGYRQRLIDNTVSWGFIDHQSFDDLNVVSDQFTNGLVTEDTGLTIKHNAINALDKNGNLIYRDATTQIAVPADSQWYWIKIAHVKSVIEQGTWSVDASGNLSGTGGELLTILRGTPNFPSRIKFTNAISNTQEFDILEVVDNNNAILNGSAGTFTAESGLKLSVVGTFTEGTAPSGSDKYPFQYDSSSFNLILETVVNTPPVLIAGLEFLLARVKNTGVDIIVQDKRLERWKTKANYRFSKVDEIANPLIGVERIMFDQLYSTKDRNKVFVQWAFSSTNYTLNTNLNIVTIVSGSGGKFKNTTFFTNGDFNGWRLYASNGKYLRIVNSVKVGSQINCYVDSMEVDYFSNDGGITFTNDQIVITPNAESIEIEFIPQDIVGTVVVETFPNLYEKFEFNINEHTGICDVLAYNDPTSYYRLVYRYKTNDNYSTETVFPDDTYGFYAESAYEADGSLKPIVLSNTYAQNISQSFIKTSIGGLVEVVIASNAYLPLINSIVTGDRLGVDRVTLDPAIAQPYTLVVGSNRIYQYFENGPFSLTQDFFINIENTGAINGNRFFLHFATQIQLNGFRLRIVTNYVNNTTFDLIEEINILDENFSSSGYWSQFEIRHDGTQWQVEHSTYDRIATAALSFSLGITNAALAATQSDVTNLQSFQNDVQASWVNASGSTVVSFYDDAGATIAGMTINASNIKYKKIGKTVHLQLFCNLDTFTLNTGTFWSYIDFDLPAILTSPPTYNQHGMCRAGSYVGPAGEFNDDDIFTAVIMQNSSKLRCNAGRQAGINPNDLSSFSSSQTVVYVNITFETA